MSKLSRGTKSSIRIKCCQICESNDLEEIISLGHLPQVNVMQKIGDDLQEELFFPAELLLCKKCSLVQMSHIVDPEIIFPPQYAYTSRTTKILRENFADLEREASQILELKSTDLIVDIGSNDGTLLNNFRKYRIQGVEPTDIADYANANSIPTLKSFFNMSVANEIILKQGSVARLVSAANVFAHIEDIHSIVDAVEVLINNIGVFVSESHYLPKLIETNQWDTIYHEHLRYYSLTSLKYLFDMHNLEIFNAKLIPTHGGSIRVYVQSKYARNKIEVNENVQQILDDEKKFLTAEQFRQFKLNIIKSKTKLYSIIDDLPVGSTIGAIGAPSRAMTLLNYIGLNQDIIYFVLEATGSNKIGKYCPGTKIPVLGETIELLCSVDYLLLLSWHIADEIMLKLREKGFMGKFIIPLSIPQILENI